MTVAIRAGPSLGTGRVGERANEWGPAASQRWRAGFFFYFCVISCGTATCAAGDRPRARGGVRGKVRHRYRERVVAEAGRGLNIGAGAPRFEAQRARELLPGPRRGITPAILCCFNDRWRLANGQKAPKRDQSCIQGPLNRGLEIDGPSLADGDAGVRDLDKCSATGWRFAWAGWLACVWGVRRMEELPRV